MKTTRCTLFYGLLLSFFIFTSCADRKRTNIFDPAYPGKTIDVGLKAIGTNAVIKLEWHNPQITKIDSTKIFRSAGNKDAFQQIARLAPSQTTFTDTSAQTDTDYFYYLTFTGADAPSPPSKTVKAITGPGSIWTLDIYTYEIQHFSYDLNQRDLRIVGIWQPEALAFNRKKHTGLVTYPIFKTYEILDLNNGRSLVSSSQKSAPMDAVYNPDQNAFWLVDSISGLYEVSGDDIDGVKRNIKLNRPEQIVKAGQSYFILQSAGREILRLDENAAIQDSITHTPDGGLFQNITRIRASTTGNGLYFSENHSGSGTLYRYDLLSHELKQVYTDTTIFGFDVDADRSSIWIIKPDRLNSSLLQLSMTGLRLQEQNGFIRPTDLRVNPYNGAILITDIGSGKIYNYRPDLSLIGVFQSNGQPYKVYIE